MDMHLVKNNVKNPYLVALYKGFFDDSGQARAAAPLAYVFYKTV
jgi:hypothetical protein